MHYYIMLPTPNPRTTDENAPFSLSIYLSLYTCTCAHDVLYILNYIYILYIYHILHYMYYIYTCIYILYVLCYICIMCYMLYMLYISYRITILIF